MNSERGCALGAALLMSLSPLAVADEQPLTFERAIARARAHAPALLSARSRVEEAGARARAASLLRDNPVLEGAVGRRQDGVVPNLDFGLSQTFELGGKRSARVAAAHAALARETAVADETTRRIVREVATAFFSAVDAKERGRLAVGAQTYAEEIVRIAQVRFGRGDVPILDVNVARSALARARADVSAAAAAEATAGGELRVLLDIPASEAVSVEGGLGDRGSLDLQSLIAAAADRADVKSLTAELADAEAEVRLGKSLGWPDIAPGVRYERDDATTVLWGGVSVTLPFFNRGQEQRGAGTVRADRIRREIAALKRAVESEVTAAWEAYSLRVKAVEALQATITALDDNEALARRSYEVGQIGLGEFLLIRRETLEARTAFVQRQLEAAQARIELEARAGVIR